MIPVRQSLALGVLMNTKGLVELIVLNVGKEKKVRFNQIGRLSGLTLANITCSPVRLKDLNLDLFCSM